MFQKELGEKIIGQFPSKNTEDCLLLSNYRLNIIKKFFVSLIVFFQNQK